MVIMNDRGMQALLTSKFKLGADAPWLPVLWDDTPKALRIGNCALKC